MNPLFRRPTTLGRYTVRGTIQTVYILEKFKRGFRLHLLQGGAGGKEKSVPSNSGSHQLVQDSVGSEIHCLFTKRGNIRQEIRYVRESRELQLFIYYCRLLRTRVVWCTSVSVFIVLQENDKKSKMCTLLTEFLNILKGV